MIHITKINFYNVGVFSLKMQLNLLENPIFLWCSHSCHRLQCSKLFLYLQPFDFSNLFAQSQNFPTQVICFFNVRIRFAFEIFLTHYFVDDSVLKGFLSRNWFSKKEHFHRFLLWWNCSDKLHSWCGAKQSPFDARSRELGFFSRQN